MADLSCAVLCHIRSYDITLQEPLHYKNLYLLLMRANMSYDVTLRDIACAIRSD